MISLSACPPDEHLLAQLSDGRSVVLPERIWMTGSPSRSPRRSKPAPTHWLPARCGLTPSLSGRHQRYETGTSGRPRAGPPDTAVTTGPALCRGFMPGVPGRGRGFGALVPALGHPGVAAPARIQRPGPIATTSLGSVLTRDEPDVVTAVRARDVGGANQTDYPRADGRRGQQRRIRAAYVHRRADENHSSASSDADAPSATYSA